MDSKLKNSELLCTSNDCFLPSLERQKRYIIRIESAQKPCPNCGTPHNVPEAAGVPFDDFDFTALRSDSDYRCSHCGRRLVFTLPLFGDWHWRLDWSEAKPKAEKE